MVKNPPAMQETGFHPWVGKIPWRRAWLSTPVFLLENPMGEDPGGLQSMGSQRIGHDSSVQVYQQEAGHGCHRCRSGLQLDQVV